jgi:hypothetical protein
MRDHAFPVWKYLTPGIALVVTFCGFVLQQYFQSQSWWADLPWLWAWTCAAAFIGGTLYADLWNRQSRLRLWWQSFRRVFEPSFHPAARDIDGIEVNTPYFLLKFHTRVNVAIELMLYEHIQYSMNKQPILISRLPPKDYVDGEQIKVPIARIPRDPNRPSHWGDNQERRILGMSGNLIEVRATKKGRLPIVQSYSVFISYGESSAETGNGYWYLREDRQVFKR